MFLFPEKIIGKSTIFPKPSSGNQAIVVKDRLVKSSKSTTKLSKSTIFPEPSPGNQAKAVFQLLAFKEESTVFPRPSLGNQVIVEDKIKVKYKAPMPA